MSLEEAKRQGKCRWCRAEWKRDHNCSYSVVQVTLEGLGDSLFFVERVIAGRKASCLVDSGASHNFVSPQLLPWSMRPSSVLVSRMARGDHAQGPSMSPLVCKGGRRRCRSL